MALRRRGVSRFGLPVRQRDLGSNLLRLSFLFKKVVVCGYCLVTLTLTINETLQWPTSLPIIQESFWWWQCSDMYNYNLPLPPPPYPIPPFSLSLISLMVFLDVKHHICLLVAACTGAAEPRPFELHVHLCAGTAARWQCSHLESPSSPDVILLFSLHCRSLTVVVGLRSVFVAVIRIVSVA